MQRLWPRFFICTRCGCYLTETNRSAEPNLCVKCFFELTEPTLREKAAIELAKKHWETVQDLAMRLHKSLEINTQLQKQVRKIRKEMRRIR